MDTPTADPPPEGAAPTATASDLRSRLGEVMLADRRRLARRLDEARRAGGDRAARLADLAEQMAASERRVAARRAAVPTVRYPAELPVSEHAADIAAAIRDHQVVIVAGETGSGKTTQIPKICLSLGRGVHGAIGHTQPRRIAARTVAERIAAELGTELGDVVGYQVRFTDRVGERTLVKLMTDGILLAEIARDRMLRRYDTIIIDEAHERSLNIDFLLGYLRQLLPRRPDLKVVVTSATIETGRFAEHFADAAGRPAPVVEVSGRTYPVQVRYRPVAADEPDRDRDQVQAISDAVDELSGEGGGDILVFLSGEREIRDTAEALRRRELRHTEVVALYARLSAAEQHRVFARHTGRRIVLATNVAETSLTVPGIRYVIDAGTARISRYSNRLKVQRLPIEPVSQASANQRKGRCGRVAEGICIRLYSEEDFDGRPEFTDPEIMRTNLASVILQMAAAKLGDIADFPFLDPPDRRQIRDGVQLLTELGALGEAGRLTQAGRRLAQLPIDPRLARMVLAAEDNDCVTEVLVIASALSIQDPRERPAEAAEQARTAHARFADPSSDFLAYLNLWRYLKEQQRQLSGNQFRRLCRAEYLNYLRVREWQDLHAQLRRAASSLSITANDADAPADRVHTALLAGLLSHIGVKDTDLKRNQKKARGPAEYLGARGARFAVFPGSSLAKKPPQWVMAAELVETSRLWARVVAGIEPSWVESLAGHLVKRHYSEPHWEKKQAAVIGYERVTLYGIPVVAHRKVNYGRIDPVVSRELFLRHALVEGDWETHHEFFAANRDLLDEAEDLERRARRRGIVVDDETLYDFYDQRVPSQVVSGRHFDSWWKKERRRRPDLLTFDPAMLVTDADAVTAADYPDAWQLDGLRLPVSYRFEPGDERDGVTVHVPLAVLGQVPAEPFAWQVPGLRTELVGTLLRTLPKALRRNLVPVPDHARAVLARIGAPTGELLSTLERELRVMTGVVVPRHAWQPQALPAHLRVNFEVLDAGGRPVAEGRDLTALKDKLAGEARAALAAAGDTIERTGLTDFDLDELPPVHEQVLAGQTVRSYPALVDEGDSVALRLLETPAAARAATWAGTRRLLLLSLPSPARYVLANLSNTAKLALTANPDGSVAALVADCTACAVDKLMADAGGPATDAAGFARLRQAVAAGLNPTVLGALRAVERVLALARSVRSEISGTTNPALLPAMTDIREQLDALVGPGFVTATGWSHLGDLPRYLTAMQHRLGRVAGNPARDRDLMGRVRALEQEYADAAAALPAGPELESVRWMLAELRVSYFAQSLGTPYPVSEKRIERALDRLPA